jgi:hypothetical protein
MFFNCPNCDQLLWIGEYRLKDPLGEYCTPECQDAHTRLLQGMPAGMPPQAEEEKGAKA